MRGVDPAGWVHHDGDADVGVVRVEHVAGMTGAIHERSGERRNGLASADVLADLGPASGRAADDVARVGEEVAIDHLACPARCGVRHRRVERERGNATRGPLGVEIGEEPGLHRRVAGVGLGRSGARRSKRGHDDEHEDRGDEAEAVKGHLGVR